jgi:hypothetical protein
VSGGAAPVELAEVPFHPQEEHHCGPASLLTVLEASGVEADYAAVVERVYVPGLEGSLQAEMTAATRAFGRLAYALPPRPEAVLAEVGAGRPVLVLLNLGVPSAPVWHYAVVVGFDPERNRMLLRSGRTERDEQQARPWLRRWEWAGRWAMAALRPGEWPAAADRGRMLRALAEFEDSADAEAAGRAWAAAAARWPDEPLVWLGVGNVAHRRGAGDEARDAYRRALALAPGHLPARLNLAVSLGEAGLACDALVELGEPPVPPHPLEAVFSETERELRLRCDG